jgi:hypothetical protein
LVINNIIDNVFRSPALLVGYSLFIFVLIGIIALTLQSNDPAFEGLEQYIYNNHNVTTYVGEVKSYHVINTRYVPASNGYARYHEYKLRVIGNNGVASLKIRADFIKEDNKWEYKVNHRYDD